MLLFERGPPCRPFAALERLLAFPLDLVALTKLRDLEPVDQLWSDLVIVVQLRSAFAGGVASPRGVATAR
jgi:hypothetical protein